MTPAPGPYDWQGGEPLTDDQLQGLCRDWVQELGLGGWGYTCKVLRQFDIGERRIGYVTIQHRAAYFSVELLHPTDYDREAIDPEMDLELALVHELCHVRYALIDYKVDEKDERDMMLYEQSIHGTARALVRMKREMRRMAGELQRLLK